MFERTFIVRYITLKKCFCYASDKHARSLEQGCALKCTYGNSTCYFTLGQYLPQLKETEIGISAVYAKILGFKENEPISVSLCGNLPGIRSVNVNPSNNDDYEILELMAESVQSTLLDQIRVVNNGQKIVIWISNSLHAVVDIDGIQPVSPGILGQLTEVVIKPPIIPENPKKKSKSSIWSINGFLKYFKSNKPTEKECILNKYKDTSVPFVFRLHPLENKSIFSNGNVFDVFVPKTILPLNLIDSKKDLLFSLNPIIEPKDLNYFEEAKTSKNIIVRLCILDDENIEIKTGMKYFLPLYVNDEILDHYNLAIGSKVVLNHVVKLQDASKVEICTNRSNFRTVKDHFKLYVAEKTKDSKQLLLNSDFLMSILDGTRVLLKFTPSLTSCLVDGDFIRNAQITVNELEIGEKKSRFPEVFEEICMDCANFEDIIEGCVKSLNLGFGDKTALENILITGPNGSGKSTLARAFGNMVKIAPKYVHVETIHCKNIKGKSLDSMHKYFTTTFLKLVYYQPSILILDDLHVICEKVADGDQPTQESLLLNKTSEMLVDLLAQYVHNNFIQIVATSESTLKLNRHIFASRGVHLFKNIFSIGDFDKNDRTKFMKFAFSKRAHLDDVDLEALSLKTEGFVAQDLVDFVDKCVFESYKNDASVVNSDHCNNALNASSSLSLRNVQLHSAGDRDFSDVGGLDDVKKILVESMLWPAQYANIFGKAPLRLQSGLLLYGPPGTGKTILAGAAAKQCNLRLISIKGPELLSKYIGASEQAVRDVFHKAQSAKPCILFFDEFDSLAPRRGHDNTGVTDRVVNQFLTQLDGVEALTGVCVLAATSRPDLLDPALLRPGRLDRQLLCPLPDEDARLAILRSLSKTLSFAEDVDLAAIAAATEGYSGADLQGVLYTAQLTSVEHLLNVDEMDHDALKEQDSETKITQQHLNESLRTTRPSLTSSERLKYDRIYAKFQGKGDLTDLKAGKQKATLA